MKRFCATDVRMRSNLGNTSETSFRKNTAQVLNLGGDSYKLGNFIENSKLYDSRSQSTFFRQTFTVKGTLGKGSFGEVFSVTSKEDNLDYALKRSLCCLRSEQDQKEAHEEVKKMQSIPHHANILRIHRAWEQKGKIYMQLDLCEKSLDDIAVIGQKVSDDDIWRYFADILLGVHHLHSNGFIHMDIKASNILIDSYGICKLADFGLMIDTKYQKHKSFHGEGDSRYLAPEILNEDPTYAADIFSFGMTMLELATDLDLPTHGDGWNILRTGQFPERFKSEVSKDLAFVILQMIQPDKFERPSSADLLRNKLLKDRVGRRQSDHFYYNTLQFFKKFIPSFLTFESKTSQIYQNARATWSLYESKGIIIQ
uniref:Protein kinase domain-containing protein n=1 Tax=Rhabditophanes sp. KR3021 TaxID=114890 RepID=A0AC35UB92_9BILA